MTVQSIVKAVMRKAVQFKPVLASIRELAEEHPEAVGAAIGVVSGSATAGAATTKAIQVEAAIHHAREGAAPPAAPASE